MVSIDYTIGIGSIAEITALLGGGLIAVGVMRSTVNNVKDKVAEMETELKDLSKAMIQLAVQNNRINNLEEDIRDLRRGRGFVLDDDKQLMFRREEKG